MTTTFSLPNTPSATLDLQIVQFDDTAKALLTEQKKDKSKDGNSLTVDFVYDTGRAADPVLVRVNKNYNPATDKTSCSVRLITRLREVDDGTSEILSDREVESVISVNYAGKFMGSSDQIAKLASLAFSLTFNGLSGANGFPGVEVLDRLDRGSLSNLFA